MQTTAARYDEVPYESTAIQRSHPAHLAAVAALFGHRAPRVESARVLEIGCATGGNLIPMADELPESEFLGVDLSARQIATGDQQIQQLGLRNISLHQQDIRGLGERWGPFDYILCHGVFSWVPREVQDHILQFIRRRLTERGVAYISYNTHPGWRLRGVVREMMHYHVQHMKDSQTQIAQARALLDFVVQSSNAHSTAYRQLLSEQADALRDSPDHYLFHEHLEQVNEPLYFWQFMERAEKERLQYLGEAEFGTMLADAFDEQTAELLHDAPLLRQEQYMDFLRNRSFRSTLLCHDAVTLDRNVPPERLRTLHVALDRPAVFSSDATRAAEIDRTESIAIGDHQVSVSRAVTKRALSLLSDVYPESLPFDELAHRAAGDSSQQATTDEEARAALGEDLLTLHARSFALLRTLPLRLTCEVTDRPVAAPTARLQARGSAEVTSRRHEPVRISEVVRRVVAQLDGKCTEADLQGQVAMWIRDGQLEVDHAGKRVTDPSTPITQQITDHALSMAARNGLLVG